MSDEYKTVTKLEYVFSLSVIFVLLPALTEGMPAVFLVDSIVSKSSRAAEHKCAVWMVKSINIHLKPADFVRTGAIGREHWILLINSNLAGEGCCVWKTGASSRSSTGLQVWLLRMAVERRCPRISPCPGAEAAAGLAWLFPASTSRRWAIRSLAQL